MTEENKVVAHYFESDVDGSKNLELIIKGMKTRILIVIEQNLDESGYIVVSDELDIFENGLLPDEFIQYIKDLEEYKWMYEENSK